MRPPTFFRWLRLYFSRQPALLKMSFFWLLGIVAGGLFSPLLALSLVLLSLAFFFYPSPRFARVNRFFPLVFSLAVYLFTLSVPVANDQGWWEEHSGRNVILSGVLVERPKVMGSTVRLRLADLYDPLSRQRPAGFVEVTLPAATIYTVGERWEFRGRLLAVPAFFFGRLYYPQAQRVTSARPSPVSFFGEVRQKLVSVLANYLPEPEASLAAGVVLGSKSGLPAGLTEDLRRTGLTHVVVVSGSNISLVTSFLLSLTRFLGRRLSGGIALLVAGLYSLLCGGGWPVWRSLLMASFLLLAKIGGREREALTALFFSAAVLTLLSPQSFGEVSFQLSFSATLGLLLFEEPLEVGLSRVLPRFLHHSGLRKSLAIPLAAQLATFPILVGRFGQISLVSPLTNFLVLAVLPYLLGSCWLLLLIGCLVPFLAAPAAALSYLPLTYFVRLAGFFGQFSWALLRL